VKALETASGVSKTVLEGPKRRWRWPFVLRVALRDFRGGLHGFGIFIACIALGVAAITGVGSVSLSLVNGLARQARVLLGGDVSFDLIQRELTPPERAFLAAHGRVSAVGLMRSMARRDDGEVALVEIKAVDGAYPLAGDVGLDPAQTLADALAEKDGVYGIVADSALLARLGVKLGDHLAIGDARYQLRALLAAEPDRLVGGLSFGPGVLMSEAALRATRLLQPGSLNHWLYRVALSPTQTTPASDAEVEDFVAFAHKAFPEAGWGIRMRKNISPQFSRNLDRFTQFLTLVGLTSLIIGGVGVANAVRAYVERKRRTIATLKSLGATGSTVFALMLTQVMLATCIGVAIGAVLGAALPFVAVWSFGALIPFPLIPAIHPSAIGQGALYGVLTALAFSLSPLGHAHDAPVQAVFREEIEPARAAVRLRYILFGVAAALGLIAAVLALSDDRKIALIYLGATLGAFALLRLVAFLIMAGARRMPHVRHVALRLAIGNIHRPGALTPSLVLSLGLGLALLVALALIDSNIRGELTANVRGETPSFYFLDVQKAKAEAFTQFIRVHAPDSKVELIPMLRGRIVQLNGLAADAEKVKSSVAWVLQGDRGISFAQDMPKGSTLVKGQWWPKDYSGPPLISLDSEVADGLGLALGDEIAVNVFGRTITGKIANMREVNWRSFGADYQLVYSPNTFISAPYNDLATLTFPLRGDADPLRGDAGRETALPREVAQAFPAVTTIRVKDALDAANAIVGQLAIAVGAASSVALLASILVLGGALAAGQQARIYDAVILKTLGATRGRILAAFLLEYGLIALCTAIFGVAAGGAAAFGIVREVMSLDFTWGWPQALGTAGSALILTIFLGLLGTWRVLGLKPAPYLREL
jgi:putative ABC transport system permease protein